MQDQMGAATHPHYKQIRAFNGNYEKLWWRLYQSVNGHTVNPGTFGHCPLASSFYWVFCFNFWLQVQVKELRALIRVGPPQLRMFSLEKLIYTCASFSSPSHHASGRDNKISQSHQTTLVEIIFAKKWIINIEEEDSTYITGRDWETDSLG